MLTRLPSSSTGYDLVIPPGSLSLVTFAKLFAPLFKGLKRMGDVGPRTFGAYLSKWWSIQVSGSCASSNMTVRIIRRNKRRNSSELTLKVMWIYTGGLLSWLARLCFETVVWVDDCSLTVIGCKADIHVLGEYIGNSSLSHGIRRLEASTTIFEFKVF